jgi:hypothetical protein
MGLLQNITLLAQNVGFSFGGTKANEMSRMGLLRDDAPLLRYAGEAGLYQQSSVPDGYCLGYTWLPPLIGGGMAAYVGTAGSGGLTNVNLASGKSIESTIVGEGVFTPPVLLAPALILAEISGSGSVTSNLAGVLYALATIAGTGEVGADIAGAVELAATIGGLGGMDAPINAVVNIYATVAAMSMFSANLAGGLYAEAGPVGSSDFSMVVKGIGNLEAELAVGVKEGDTWPSASQISEAVWTAASATLLTQRIERILGLVQENFRLTNQSYDSDGNLVSATMRLFANDTDAQSNTNPIATYAMSATFEGQGICTSYLVKRTT